jgi:2-iminobutanoate/2-iminopropanoate deaminase
MMMRRLAPLVLLLAAACAPKSEVEFRPRPNAPGPFSEAVRVDDILYLSGAIGTDSTGRLVPGGIEAETRQTLENIKATLARNGLRMEHIFKCTAMLVDIAEWPRMNVIYATYFPGPKPARSAFAGTGLALGARMELECWAAIPKGR